MDDELIFSSLVFLSVASVSSFILDSDLYKLSSVESSSSLPGGVEFSAIAGVTCSLPDAVASSEPDGGLTSASRPVTCSAPKKASC